MKTSKERRNVSPFTFEDYIVELVKSLPVAIIGGFAGAAFHAKRILKAKGKLAKLCLFVTEWSTGAFFAAMTSFLFPIVTQQVGIESSITVEIGVCGFLGGTGGVVIYKGLMRKIFGIETE